MSGCPHAILIRAACKRKNLATSQVWSESHQIRRFKRLVSGQRGISIAPKAGVLRPVPRRSAFLDRLQWHRRFLETGSRIFWSEYLAYSVKDHVLFGGLRHRLPDLVPQFHGYQTQKLEKMAFRQCA